jgi:hypothetical protein
MPASLVNGYPQVATEFVEPAPYNCKGGPDCAPAQKSGLPGFCTIDAEIGNSRSRLADASSGLRGVRHMGSSAHGIADL